LNLENVEKNLSNGINHYKQAFRISAFFVFQSFFTTLVPDLAQDKKALEYCYCYYTSKREKCRVYHGFGQALLVIIFFFLDLRQFLLMSQLPKE